MFWILKIAYVGQASRLTSNDLRSQAGRPRYIPQVQKLSKRTCRICAFFCQSPLEGIIRAHPRNLIPHAHPFRAALGVLSRSAQLGLVLLDPPDPPENPVILSKKSSGFTLLELLVAVAVLSILLVILLNIVQGTANLWRNSENKVEAYREARAAMQVISTDLKNILASTNIDFFRTNLTNSPNLGFLATLPTSSQDANSLSDVCTVGYYRAYGNKSPVGGTSGRQSYNLYRYFVESNETFTNLTNISASVLDWDSKKTPEILARNVLSFNATYFVTNSSGGFTPWVQSAITPMPHVIEIQITAINNERTMRFPARNASIEWDNFSANTNASDYIKNTKTFTTRIPLKAP